MVKQLLTKWGRRVRSAVVELTWRLSDWCAECKGAWTRNEPLSGLLAVSSGYSTGDAEPVMSGVQWSRFERLSRYLRRTPYWSAGHLRLSRVALELDQVHAAYASLRALEQLIKPAALPAEAQHLLARCYMRRGAVDKALALLEKLVERSSDTMLHEDLAAALLANGEHGEAKRVIESIPVENRSSQVEAALRYLTLRTTDPQHGDGEK